MYAIFKIGPLKSSVSPTFISPMCFDILPCSYVLTARSRWPFTFGRDSGVYGRMTLARLPSSFTEPIGAFVRRHDATVMPLTASASS